MRFTEIGVWLVVGGLIFEAFTKFRSNWGLTAAAGLALILSPSAETEHFLE